MKPAARVEHIKLAALVELKPGYVVPPGTQPTPAGAYRVVMARDVDPDGPCELDASLLSTRMELPGAAKKYELRDGDVVFVSRGTANRAVALRAVPPDTIAPLLFHTLRPRSALFRPAYLSWFLNQPRTLATIAEMRAGTGTQLVNWRVLAELEVPVPPLAGQDRIVELGLLMQRERRLQRDLADSTDSLHRAFSNGILDALASN